MIVPSVAFLDQRERWNVVVFVDRLRGELATAIRLDDPVLRVAVARASRI
jgi:hypothetical protein